MGEFGGCSFSSLPSLRFRVQMLPSFTRGTAEATVASGDALSTCAEPAHAHLRSSDSGLGRQGGRRSPCTAGEDEGTRC